MNNTMRSTLFCRSPQPHAECFYGTDELRGAITDWIARRYGVTLDPAQNVMALNGTREGLYNAAMALCPETKNGAQPVVLSPNPFYQVYMIGAISVGAPSPPPLPSSSNCSSSTSSLSFSVVGRPPRSLMRLLSAVRDSKIKRSRMRMRRTST